MDFWAGSPRRPLQPPPPPSSSWDEAMNKGTFTFSHFYLEAKSMFM